MQIKTYSEFIRYLKQKNIYHLFRYNFKEESNHIHTHLGEEGWFKKRTIVFNEKEKYVGYNFVHFGFIWSKTPEGHEFWYKIEIELE